jgi:TetR/AcrR family fatty acid metabolism transcriptional regulator
MNVWAIMFSEAGEGGPKGDLEPREPERRAPRSEADVGESSAIASPAESTAPAASGPGPRQEASEQRRRRMLDAARTCFGRDGYAGATVARIAREAGVSNGLLYQFFRNKQHLFEVVLGDVIRDWVRVMVPRAEVETTAAAKLEGMLRRSVEFCRTTPLLPALLSRDRALQLQRIAGVTKDRVEPHRELVASILREGIASGEFRPDLDVRSLSDAICLLQSEYSTRAYTDSPRFRLDPPLVDAVARMIHDAVRAR